MRDLGFSSSIRSIAEILSLGIPFLETSAKNSTNVESAFLTMAAEIKKRYCSVSPPPFSLSLSLLLLFSLFRPSLPLRLGGDSSKPDDKKDNVYIGKTKPVKAKEGCNC